MYVFSLAYLCRFQQPSIESVHAKGGSKLVISISSLTVFFRMQKEECGLQMLQMEQVNRQVVPRVDT